MFKPFSRYFSILDSKGVDSGGIPHVWPEGDGAHIHPPHVVHMKKKMSPKITYMTFFTMHDQLLFFIQGFYREK